MIHLLRCAWYSWRLHQADRRLDRLIAYANDLDAQILEETYRINALVIATEVECEGIATANLSTLQSASIWQHLPKRTTRQLATAGLIRPLP